MNTKIIIQISGGVVQSVRSTSPDTDVEIVDWDNLRANGPLSETETEAILERTEKEAPHVAY